MLYDLGERRVVLASDAFVAPNASLIGSVTLEAGASVWFSAVLRADNEPITIGARSNVQEGAMIHVDPGIPVTVGADVTIGHHAILHGCTVGEASLIGMGATVLNGARIGRFCIVVANALVTEGKEFPDFSLIVGSPAKVVRVMDAGMEEKLRQSAAHYVANWQRYAAGLVRLD